jgi:hypothetical protein
LAASQQSLFDLVPSNKHDIGKVAALEALGYPAIDPILPQLLVWIQDINWPVARKLCPVLAGIGQPLAPYLREVLRGSDDIWIYWILNDIVSHSPSLVQSLKDELTYLAESGSQEEGVRDLARELCREL